MKSQEESSPSAEVQPCRGQALELADVSVFTCWVASIECGTRDSQLYRRGMPHLSLRNVKLSILINEGTIGRSMEMFLISTPEDKGESSRHIQTINAHSAHIKHQSIVPISKRIPGTASSEQGNWRLISRLQQLRDKSHTTIRSQLPYPVANFDQLLQSTLDPFVRLPVAITSYERLLLHYCLTHGGRLSTVPASQNVFDPTVYAASHLLHADKMYVLVHLAMGEWMICQRRRVAVSALAYHWRAQAYRHMSELLMSAKSPFLIRMSGLFQLALMEQVYCELPLQAKHLSALHHLIEECGGLEQFKAARTGSGPHLGVSFVTSFFTFAEIPFTDSSTFDLALGRFSHNLRNLSALNRSLIYDESIRINGNASLAKLRVYVDWLLKAYLSQPSTPYRLRAGAFGFIFSLSMSLATYGLTGVYSFHFLIRLEQCMHASMKVLSSCPHSLCPIDSIPCSAMWLLGYVRGCVFVALEEKEIEISQSLLDGLRLLRYMSSADILWLATFLAQSALGVFGEFPMAYSGVRVESLIQGLRDNGRRLDNCFAQATFAKDSS